MRKSILFLSLLLSAAPLAADTVYMDSGETIEGTIVSRNEETVIIRTQGGREEINKRFIKRITSPAIEQNSATRESRTDEAAETNHAPEARPMQSLRENDEERWWMDDTSKKRATSAPAGKTGTMMHENLIKLSIDLIGTHHVASSISAAGSSASGNATEDTTEGFTLAAERVGYLDDNVGLGAGWSYQMPRKMRNYEGNFSFMPFYGIFKIRSTPTAQRTYFYGVGQLGYNLFFGDTNYKGSSGKLTGGMYYGLGLGWIISNLNIEFLYSVNRGSIKDSGYVYGNYGYYYAELKGDIDYSQINMKIGVNF